MTAGEGGWAEGDILDGQQFVNGEWIALPDPPPAQELWLEVSYWTRYRRRWPKVLLCCLVFAIIQTWANHAEAQRLADHRESPGQSLASIIVVGLIAGLIYASLLTFCVAAFPPRRRKL